MIRRIALAIALTTAVVVTVESQVPAARAASLVQVTGFGTNPGNLAMWKYVPDNLPAGRPVVVAMHGCTQMASAYDAETGWTKYADLWGFALVLPEQQTANNSSRCFNWFEAGDYARGAGEALSIKQMVDKMKTDHGSDAGRVYVTGLSAGGAMTSVMLATYPDVFAGGAVMSGVAYKCATGSSQAFSCMSPGVDKTPQQWGDLVRGAFSYGGTRPRVSIWHGTQDFTVATMNLAESMQQWTNVAGVDQTADVTNTVAGYPHNVYNDASGVAQVETYTITNMGHGTPVDPGPATEQCGTAGAYILDVNICSSYHIASFWGLNSNPPPTTTTAPPGTTTTLPATTTTTAAGGGAADVANNDANDGYVKADANGANASIGTFANLALGRGTDSLFNRAVLSFDTSAIPDAATVTRAYVTVTWSSGSGDPWANPAGNTLVVDVKNGCFGACTIETGDWLAAPSATAAATIAKFTSGSRSSSDFDAAGRSSVSKTATTQLKLRFSANQTSTNYLFIRSGALATLHVQWA